MSNDLRDATDADCVKNGTKFRYFDKDGKLQQGLNPVIEHGFIQVGKVELQPSVIFKSCPDCARLKALLADVWSAYLRFTSIEKDSAQYEEFFFTHKNIEARIKQEGI